MREAHHRLGKGKPKHGTRKAAVHEGKLKGTKGKATGVRPIRPAASSAKAPRQTKRSRSALNKIFI